ncbi:MAG: cytochrome c [Desulfopila sp.]|jgi:mono/diheme cytochrome c family protein|nr:cytochrome c [Desulfopila sp.]
MKITEKISLYITISALCIFVASHSFAHSWMAPEDEARNINPVELSDKSVANGQKIFENKCSYCHGNSARGLSKDDTGLAQDTPNLIQRLDNHTDGDFHWKIINGKDAMPSFKDDLSDNDIWNIINYLKTVNE